MAPKTQLYTREVEAIDPVAKTVRLAAGVRPNALTLEYEHLIVAMGTDLDYSKIPGMREHAHPFKYLGDALYLETNSCACSRRPRRKPILRNAGAC